MSFLSGIFGSKEDVNYKQLLKEGAIIVDVRTAEEYGVGHIPGSINIPLDTINKQVPELKAKGVTIITCCRSGNRSGLAKNILASNDIPSLNGGAWDHLLEQIKFW